MIIDSILVTGSHRSGTTWVGKAIAASPRIIYAHEPFNVASPNPAFRLDLRTWYFCLEHAEPEDQMRISRCFDNILRPFIPYAVLEQSRLKALRRMTGFLLAPKKPKLLIKDPLALLSAPFLHQRYGTKVICLIRNPLSFVGSLSHAGWDFDFNNLSSQPGLISRLSDDLQWKVAETLSRQLDGSRMAYIQRCSLLWSVLHSFILAYQTQFPEWLFLRHEDLTRDPLGQFGKIFDFLNLGFSSRCKEFIQLHGKSDVSLMPSTASTQFRPRDSLAVNTLYRTRLEPHEQDVIRHETMQLAGQFGYDLS